MVKPRSVARCRGNRFLYWWNFFVPAARVRGPSGRPHWYDGTHDSYLWRKVADFFAAHLT